MTTSPVALLALYSLAIAGFSLLGGLLPGWVKMTHVRTQLIMSLVSGLMLGVAFYHLLPHSIMMYAGPGAIDSAVWWLMLGLIAMLLLLRLFHFHQHDFSQEAGEHHHHDGDSHHVAHELSWVGVALGLGLHTVIDGVALGAVMRSAEEGVALAGAGVFLAILLHKPLDAMSIAALMRAAGASRSLQRNINIGFALLCPLGALLFYAFANGVSSGQSEVVAAALAFSAGAFICIALSDLLPEVQFHSHDRVKLTLVFLAGLAVSYAIATGSPEHSHQISDTHSHSSGH